MVQWAVAHGATGVERLRFGCSSEQGGGTGVFAAACIDPGGRIASLPDSCVLTTGRALRSALGRGCRAVLPDSDPFFVFLLWLAVGRRDPSHAFHTYLSSLPQQVCPSATS